MHASMFSYNLTRPYPFRWFTPVTTLGGFVVLTLFSVLNLAASGYDLRTIYTTDPNATLSEARWFNQPPWSSIAHSQASCTSIGIPLGSQVFTSNLGMSYTLTAVSAHDEQQGRDIAYPSLPYLNQTLQNCLVDKIELQLQKLDSTTSESGAWWSWDARSAAATVTCDFVASGQRFNATFQTNYVPQVAAFDSILQMNATTGASTWWGAWLLNKYWASILWSVYQIDFPGDFSPGWAHGYFTFTPNSSIQDIKDNAFFALDYNFVNDDGQLVNGLHDFDQLYNNQTSGNFSQTFTETLSWARTLYSFVLVDFGQQSRQNLLTDPDLLQWFLQYPEDIFRHDPQNPLNCTVDNCLNTFSFSRDFGLIAAPDDPDQDKGRTIPMDEAWNALQGKVGPLGAQSATIFSQYACQVPVLKPAGTIIVTVFLADLVFLQGCWVILVWIADTLVQKRDPMALYCKGCSSYRDAPALAVASASATTSLESLKLQSSEYEVIDWGSEGDNLPRDARR